MFVTTDPYTKPSYHSGAVLSPSSHFMPSSRVSVFLHESGVRQSAALARPVTNCYTFLNTHHCWYSAVSDASCQDHPLRCRSAAPGLGSLQPPPSGFTILGPRPPKAITGATTMPGRCQNHHTIVGSLSAIFSFFAPFAIKMTGSYRVVTHQLRSEHEIQISEHFFFRVVFCHCDVTGSNYHLVPRCGANRETAPRPSQTWLSSLLNKTPPDGTVIPRHGDRRFSYQHRSLYSVSPSWIS